MDDLGAIFITSLSLKSSRAVSAVASGISPIAGGSCAQLQREIKLVRGRHLIDLADLGSSPAESVGSSASSSSPIVRTVDGAVMC
jgi:hypothetical protein